MRELIAILRGVTPKEVLTVAEAVLESGISTIEVPLNSPDAFKSIERLVIAFGNESSIGAGTVLSERDVGRLHDIGGKLVVSPDCNPKVIAKTKALKMLSFPGVLTPTECFQALQFGADGLKFFPSSLIGPNGLASILAVLPKGQKTYAVGGAGPDNFQDWFAAGVTGFGIGTALYRPGDNADSVRSAAQSIVRSYDNARQRSHDLTR